MRTETDSPRSAWNEWLTAQRNVLYYERRIPRTQLWLNIAAVLAGIALCSFFVAASFAYVRTMCCLFALEVVTVFVAPVLQQEILDFELLLAEYKELELAWKGVYEAGTGVLPGDALRANWHLEIVERLERRLHPTPDEVLLTECHNVIVYRMKGKV